MDGFFDKFRSVQPYLVNDVAARPSASGSSPPSDRARYDDTTKCILCAACTTSCPSFWAQPSYVGPAAIVNAHRFIFDSRDDGGRGAAGDPRRQGRRVALPDDLQLHRRLPARDPHHPGDPRGELGDRGTQGLSEHAVRRTGDRAGEPVGDAAGRTGRRRTASSSAPTARPAATPGRRRSGAALFDLDRPDARDPPGRPRRHDLGVPRRPDQQRRRVHRASCGRSSWPSELGAARGRTCCWTRS